MLVAALSPSAVLQTQTQTRTVSSQRRQLEAYHTPVPSPPMSLPVLAPAHVSAPQAVQMQVVSQVPLSVEQSMEVPVAVSVHDRLLAAQLAHFASQHHMSDYNKFKFGQKGSPFAYVPFSLQAPGQVRELRSRQARYTERRAWWISEAGSCDLPERPACPVGQFNSEGPTQPMMFTSSSSASDISQEISAAISSEMRLTHITKTSKSHPINVSMVILPDVLPVIASQLVPASLHSPFMLQVPENCHLNRLIAPVQATCNPFYFAHYLPSMRPPVTVTWAQQGSNELQQALNGELTFSPPRPLFVPSHDRHGIRSPIELPLPPAMHVPVPTPPSPPRGVIRRRPLLVRATSAPPAFRTFKGVQRRVSNLKEPRQRLFRNRSSPEVSTKRLDSTVTTAPCGPLDRKAVELVDSDDRVDELSNNASRLGLMLPPSSVAPNPVSRPSLTPAVNGAIANGIDDVQRLGNLYLSSCPGKKVRLSGPVKGRSAICRDLRADLSRMKELGVGCIICCLDDTELDFLGASWLEYSSLASELGLDVLRIPIPEGLDPLSPASLDAHLKRVIETYTLRGVPVLAHCRGGVGRAGLIACCWMLKLGLCGWKDPLVCAQSCGEHARCNQSLAPAMQGTIHDSEKLPSYKDYFPIPQSQTGNQIHVDELPPAPAPVNVPRVCRATVQLMERALAVIRRRRSPKAIETYEQVRFLVEYIEYLDEEARHHSQGPFN